MAPQPAAHLGPRSGPGAVGVCVELLWGASVDGEGRPDGTGQVKHRAVRPKCAPCSVGPAGGEGWVPLWEALPWSVVSGGLDEVTGQICKVPWS